MMRTVRCASIFSVAGRLLSGGRCRSYLEVCDACCVELGELVVLVSERMSHIWLLEWRIVPTAARNDVRLKVPSCHLTDAQGIVVVARIGADGRVAVNHGGKPV